MLEFYQNIKRYFSYTIYSAKSKLKSEVAKSYLNALWWILNPLCYMLIYIFIVEVVFKTSEPNFPIFVFIGLTLWDYFSKMISNSIKLIQHNKNIITKVYIPKYILLIVTSFTLLFKMAISIAIIFILMFFFNVTISMKFLLMIPIILVLYVVTFGIGLLLMHIGVFVEDLSNIIDILLKFIFYFSGIFYSISTRIPSPFSDILLQLNPIAYLIDAARKIILLNTYYNFGVLALWLTVGIILSIFGLKVIRKYENSYVKVMK